MLTEPVDYDLDTHPITAGAAFMQIRAGLLACNCTSSAGLCEAQSLRKSAVEQSECGLRA
jgi:hypothetical protein